MNKGSPGGILLIAVGVVLLSLGFTGRIKQVAEALTGSGGTSGGTDDTGDSDSSPDGENPDEDGGLTPAQTELVKKATCRTGTKSVWDVDKGTVICTTVDSITPVDKDRKCTGDNNVLAFDVGTGAWFCTKSTNTSKPTGGSSGGGEVIKEVNTVSASGAKARIASAKTPDRIFTNG